MYDYSKLRGLIKQYFNTQAKFAQHLGIGLTTLVSRLNGDTYFSQDEIDKSIKAFKISTIEELEQTFFVKK
jgi:hypothetical protein